MNIKIFFAILLLVQIKPDIFADPIVLSFRKDGWNYIVNLPYQSTRERSKVFSDNFFYALDILEITVDGEPLMQTYGPIIYEESWYIKTRPINKEEKELEFPMLWSIIPGVDEIYYFDRDINNSYKIKKGDKELRMKYRIIFPFAFMSLGKLWTKKGIPQSAYSQEYEMAVNLENIFNE